MRLDIKRLKNQTFPPELLKKVQTYLVTPLLHQYQLRWFFQLTQFYLKGTSLLSSPFLLGLMREIYCRVRVLQLISADGNLLYSSDYPSCKFKRLVCGTRYRTRSLVIPLHKKWSFPLKIPSDLATFTEEILNGKLCSDFCSNRW